MQPPRNPTRRNKNIGTARQGHGQNNALVIPDRSDGLYWLDRIGEHVVEDRLVSNQSVRFIVETNTSNCVHPCTVSDVVRILEALPQTDWTGLHTFVLRQPTRKQLALDPAWGRLEYFADISNSKGKRIAIGPTIFLDAINPDKAMIWSTSLDPHDSQELERLRKDGHLVRREGREHHISVSTSSARNTQLYRTLLHEVGHWFDWLSKVEVPALQGDDREGLERHYFARPSAEREAFAHRYADAQRLRLEADGVIPFAQFN